MWHGGPIGEALCPPPVGRPLVSRQPLSGEEVAQPKEAPEAPPDPALGPCGRPEPGEARLYLVELES